MKKLLIMVWVVFTLTGCYVKVPRHSIESAIKFCKGIDNVIDVRFDETGEIFVRCNDSPKLVKIP